MSARENEIGREGERERERDRVWRRGLGSKARATN